MPCLEQPCSDDREVHLGVAWHDEVDDVAPPDAEAAVEDPRHLPGSRLNLRREIISLRLGSNLTQSWHFHLGQIVALRAEHIARPSRPPGPVDQPRTIAILGNVLLNLLEKYLHTEFKLLLICTTILINIFISILIFHQWIKFNG